MESFLHSGCPLTWWFKYDKINYARYLIPYYAQMTQALNTEQDNPEIQQAFKDGNFSVQILTSNPFAKLPVDQVTGGTVNKDTQTPCETTKFSLNSAAVWHY